MLGWWNPTKKTTNDIFETQFPVSNIWCFCRKAHLNNPAMSATRQAANQTASIAVPSLVLRSVIGPSVRRRRRWRFENLKRKSLWKGKRFQSFRANKLRGIANTITATDASTPSIRCGPQRKRGIQWHCVDEYRPRVYELSLERKNKVINLGIFLQEARLVTICVSCKWVVFTVEIRIESNDLLMGPIELKQRHGAPFAIRWRVYCDRPFGECRFWQVFVAGTNAG